ncbi:MAG TPA: DNA integrity scanning diadenylate cyclase DisA [Thermotogota bacterium]|jgi:diadenylate cyclase|nr:DNA integrity scanning protein DisA [Thermotogaceae bacterium]OQC31512.1 MAG: DNA integrity scanning protein DisA [Thermotogota bacterium ADurb.Bin062]HNW47405.1 DNA integrity scanning diadenylate cyclase DisA [Thermotogota bacterium]HNY82780.1 DNA integrity scanning diadenylate cyclase DisA [Thermotogota bacterium]HOD91095.1 DNA integrity scanning diadenylate cyclase DisA [Thermotogota bacterium]
MAKIELFKEIMQMIAPGTELRNGIDNILSAKSGALIVLMSEEDIKRWQTLVQPGFYVNCEFSAQRLFELSKMDGAVIITEDAKRILYANVQLAPNSDIPTFETGMRHRNAERFAKQTGRPAVAISRRRSIISVYWGGFHYVLNDYNLLFTKLNQGLKALEKYSDSFTKALDALEVLEVEGLVTLFDICKTIEKAVRAQMVANEIEPYILETGVDGRLIQMQKDEMLREIIETIELLVLDYYNTETALEGSKLKEVFSRFFQMTEKELGDYNRLASVLGYKPDTTVTEYTVFPKGFRLLRKIPKIPMSVIYNLVRRFSNLPGIESATLEDLKKVDGIGEARARAIILGFANLRKKINLSER